MKSKRVLRYYCDHCRKGGCNKWCMEKHEKRCVRNPQRICGFCSLSQLSQKSISELIHALGSGGMPALKEAATNCPACILSALVQARFTPVDGGSIYYDFNYKEAVAEFWREHRALQAEEMANLRPTEL